jgi:hypothetical protein
MVIMKLFRKIPLLLTGWFIQTARLSWLSNVLSALGGLLYFLQARYYIFLIPSTLDEGNYLYKGYLFVTGVYLPYQDYGPWTNKMPLGFLLNGWVQMLFEPGIRTGRYFAIFLGLLLLLALWLAARRLAGAWWGAAAVWMVAANPGLISMYSQAHSEGIVACLIAWTLVFSLGEGIPRWKLTLAGILVGLTLITRENMLPWVGLWMLYILWQYRWRGLLAGAAPLLTILIAVHVAYYPNILRLWAVWLPPEITPFLNFVRIQAAETTWKVQTDLPSRLFAFFESFRYHFIPQVGALITWVLFPRRESWRRPGDLRAAVFLSVALLVLNAVHAWASIGNDYCVYCYSLYIGFYIPIGFLLLVLAASAWQLRLSPLRQIFAVLLTLILSTGMGFALYQEMESTLLTIQVPRLRGMQILPGTTDLWRLLANKFSYSYELLKQVLPAIAGLLFGILLVVLMFVLFAFWKRRKNVLSAGAAVLLFFYLAGVLLTPTIYLGGANPVVDCGGDVIASYEAVGADLAKTLPPGAQVDWRGGLSPVPLLYVPDIRIYPPQLNDGYSRRVGGDPAELIKRGFWDDSLSSRWLHETDFLLAEKAVLKNLSSTLDAIGYEQVMVTPPLITCRDNSPIYVLRRIH